MVGAKQTFTKFCDVAQAASEPLGFVSVPEGTANATTLHLGEEPLSIPRRMYFDPPFLQTVRLTERQSQVLDCLFTRHHDGSVRQKHLAQIIPIPKNPTGKFLTADAA
jgi:hypothetical protein